MKAQVIDMFDTVLLQRIASKAVTESLLTGDLKRQRTASLLVDRLRNARDRRVEDLDPERFVESGDNNQRSDGETADIFLFPSDRAVAWLEELGSGRA